MGQWRRVLPLFVAIVGLLGVVSAAPASCADVAPTAWHVIYLHGRIVQVEQSRRPVHSRFGPYELDAILRAFRERGFEVEGEVRPKDDTVESAATRVVSRAREMLASGVPPQRIGVVGASMGAGIAFLASARLQEPEVRFAVLGACLSKNASALAASEGRGLRGRILSIREKSDDLTEPCPAFAAGAAGPGLRAREIVLETGLAHGFLYRPLPEWLDPVVSWLREP